MKLADVLAEIAPIVGLTSLVAAPGSVGGPANGTPDLASAQTKLDQLRTAQANCTSDAAYWGYVGQIAYWRTVVNLLRAAEKVGPDSLPDVPLPGRGGVVMDSAWELGEFGARVALAAGLEPTR